MFSRLLKIILFFFVFVVLFVGVFYFLVFRPDYRNPFNPDDQVKKFDIQEGEGVWEIAQKLRNQKLIRNPVSLVIGGWMDGKIGSFKVGSYKLSTNLSPAEIVEFLTRKDARTAQVQVTFPEGWTAEKMSKRLNQYDLPGEKFLELVRYPPERITAPYRFLSDFPKGSSLEGYLFPDTYRFYADAMEQDIVVKMLDTFSEKISQDFYQGIASQKKKMRDVVIMASILEGEVRLFEEKKIVSGIFWKRMNEDIPLQSDATLEYVLKTNAVQHTREETKNDSPYNTYVHKGLPPGPISNPSTQSLMASLYPESSEYYFFLSDPATGKTYFAKTFEEHIANKNKVGL